MQFILSSTLSFCKFHLRCMGSGATAPPQCSVSVSCKVAWTTRATPPLQSCTVQAAVQQPCTLQSTATSKTAPTPAEHPATIFPTPLQQLELEKRAIKQLGAGELDAWQAQREAAATTIQAHWWGSRQRQQLKLSHSALVSWPCGVQQQQ